jgi:hypothetical protein
MIIKADSQNRLKGYGSGSLGRRVHVNQVHVEPWVSELMDTELSFDTNIILEPDSQRMKTPDSVCWHQADVEPYSVLRL